MKKKNSVFVSSVYSELVEERRAVINAITQEGDWPVCMEMFDSCQGNSLDILKQYINECDYFVLIIGDEYGDIEPTKRLSYTECEYDIAIELGLRPLVFLKKSIKRNKLTQKFVNKISNAQIGLWREWTSITELVTLVVSSLRNAEKADPRDGWVRGGIKAETCSSIQYSEFVVNAEMQANELIILPKRLNTVYKPKAMIEEIARQRYGHGSDHRNYQKYIDAHMKRSKQFFDFLEKGGFYYELFNKSTLIEYVKGMHHNGIKNLNIKYMLEMLEKWKETICKYQDNYFIGLVDAILPFKYEIIDRRVVSMHETVGRHSKNRVSAIVIKEEQVVKNLVNDFETIWNNLEPEDITAEAVCAWIDEFLIGALRRGEHETSRHVRPLDLFGMCNCRDLGGLETEEGNVTRHGMIYRADLPCKADRLDMEKLRQLNITLCIDIRHPSSAEKNPSVFRDVEDVKYINIGYSDKSDAEISGKLDDDDFDAKEWGEIYVGILQKERDWVRCIFEEIAQNTGATIFHCTWGRDRSGLLSILLLLLAEVEEDEIIADYMMSNVYCRKLKSRNHSKRGSRNVEINTAQCMIDYIKDKEGGIERYLRCCGVSKEDIKEVKRKLVKMK
ncbi:MAG: tyrosine-protein phosphatase [Clostridia bacterium]|nr:tyrosine-protein phosphatase [Clostridia bacterium]